MSSGSDVPFTKGLGDLWAWCAGPGVTCTLPLGATTDGKPLGDDSIIAKPVSGANFGVVNISSEEDEEDLLEALETVKPWL